MGVDIRAKFHNTFSRNVRDLVSTHVSSRKNCESRKLDRIPRVRKDGQRFSLTSLGDGEREMQATLTAVVYVALS